MLSKIIKVVFVVAIVAYLSLWAWSIRWIDNSDELDVFNNNRSLFPIAKMAWKVTPALNTEKDAERLLKVASFSVLPRNMENIEYEKFESNLKNSYQLISSYYNKNKDKLSDEMKNKFALKKLIFINRSFKTIEDGDFETSITQIESEITKFPLEEQAAWYNELAFYYGLFDISKYDDTYSAQQIEHANIHNDNLIKTVGKLNKENKTKDFSVLFLLHTGIKGCLYSYMYQNTFSNDTLSEMMSISEDYMKKLNTKLNSSATARKIFIQYLKNDLNAIAFSQSGGGGKICEKEVNNIIDTLLKYQNELNF